MRARSWSGLTVAMVLALALPAAVSAQSSSLVADNPGNDCEAPLPATMVAGDLSTVVVVDDEAEIDKVTLASDYGAEVVDADFSDGGHEATISVTDDVSAYIVWSCAPMNGEPIQRNDDQEV